MLSRAVSRAFVEPVVLVVLVEVVAWVSLVVLRAGISVVVVLLILVVASDVLDNVSTVCYFLERAMLH